MEAAIGLQCKSFTIIASDRTYKTSYLILNSSSSKFANCSNTLICYLGDQGDSFRTTNYVIERLKYEEINYNLKPNANIISNVIQNYNHKLLRTNPRNNYFLVGDYQSLYSIDVYGTLSQSFYFAVGIGSYFCYGIIDKEYKWDMEVDDAIKIVKKCFRVLEDRCSIDIGEIDIRIVDRKGVHEVGGGVCGESEKCFDDGVKIE